MGRRLLVLLLWGLVVLAIASFVGAGETRGQTPNQASLSVDFGNGRVERYCVTFEEESISGAELLERSGLPVLYSGFGSLGSGVCRIDDTGCSDPSDCFCQCRGADCHYWTYFSLDEGEWRYQNVGASQRTVHDGDADAWVWGNGRDRSQGPATVCTTPTSARPPPAATQPPPATPVAPDSVAPGQGGQVSMTVPAAPAGAAATGSGESRATPRATNEVRRADNRGGERGSSGARESDGGSTPAGLIAFGAVAGTLIVGVGGLLAWRRVRG